MWLWIATDGGRERLVECDFDSSTEALLESIRQGGTDKNAFFKGPYAETIQKVIVGKSTSRFGDGYCGAKTALWKIGTREAFGEEHPGYSFFF